MVTVSEVSVVESGSNSVASASAMFTGGPSSVQATAKSAPLWPELLSASRSNTGSGVAIETARLNSDVLPVGSVAVAVITCPVVTETPINVVLTVALPLPSVVTESVPR